MSVKKMYLQNLFYFRSLKNGVITQMCLFLSTQSLVQFLDNLCALLGDLVDTNDCFFYHLFKKNSFNALQ